jgi:hypothetical protein
MGLSQVPAIAPVTSVGGTAGRTTSSGGTTPVLDLATSGVSATTYGSASLIPALTVDAYGRVTSATTNAFSASSMTVLLSGSVPTGTNTFTISSIPDTHTNLRVVFFNLTRGTTPGDLTLNLNGITTTTYGITNITGTTVTSGSGNAAISIGNSIIRTDSNGSLGIADFYHYANTSIPKVYATQGFAGNSGTSTRYGGLQTLNAISSITCFSPSYNYTGGTYIVYGIK